MWTQLNALACELLAKGNAKLHASYEGTDMDQNIRDLGAACAYNDAARMVMSLMELHKADMI